jgi:hypothetical protein
LCDTNKDDSAASFCHQAAAWVQDIFFDLYYFTEWPLGGKVNLDVAGHFCPALLPLDDVIGTIFKANSSMNLIKTRSAKYIYSVNNSI